MKEMGEISEVVAHAFEDDENLNMALTVGLAFTTIKERIVQDFLSSLGVSLRTTLEESFASGWQVEMDGTKTPLTAKWFIEAWKPVWNVNASIGINCDKLGSAEINHFVYLEGRPEESLAVKLRSALEATYMHGYGQGTPNYPWWQYADDRHRDWTTKAALLALRTKADPLEYHLTHLRRIAEIVVPILDQADSVSSSYDQPS